MILNEFFDSNTNQLRITEGIAPQDNDPWGPQGNFAGDKHVDIGGVTMKIIQVGDIVKYLGQQAKVVGMSKDRKYSRISIGSGFGGSVKDVLTADLKQLGQGVAEGLNEFDAQGFQQRYTLYKDDYEIEKFGDMDNAIEYAENDRRDGDDPSAVYKIVDINQQVVWDSNPHEKPSRIQLRKLEQGVVEGSGQDSFVQRLGRKLQQSGYTQTGPGTWSQVPDGREVSVTPLPDGRYGWELRRVNRRGKWYSGVDTEQEVVDIFNQFKIFSKHPVDEGLVEVSDATKQSYKAKSQAQVQQLEPHAKKGEYRDIAQRAIDRRQRGLTRFQDKTNVKSVSETGMKAKSIEFQDYKTMTPLAFHSRYGMTRDDWMTQNRNLFAKFNPAHRARDTALAKMRQAAAARADVKAAQTLAPRVSEGLTVPEGRPALGQANITTLIQTYKRNEPFAELSFGNSGNLRINRQQMRLIMDHYLKLQTPEEKHDFVYETMSRMLKLIAMFDVYGVDVRSQIAVPPGQSSPVPGAQPQLFELDAGEVKDTRLSRALKQARAEFPTAGSDIEAFLKLVMSNDDRDLAAMKRMQDVNKKQGELLDRIQNIDQKQNQEIGNLESELNRVTAVNQNLERELDRIQSAKPAAAADREPRKDTAEKPAAAKPAARVDLPVGQDISTKTAKKTKSQVPSKVGYGIPTSYKTTLQPPKYSMPQLQAPAQALLPATAQRTADQSDLFRDITDVIPRAVAPSTNGIKRNPVISSLDQEITDIFQPAANDPEDQRQANAESRDPQRAIAHTDFDSPEWHEKVRGIGQRAKQGPLKTVWDEKRKVFRNVPVDRPPANNNPNMNEARLHRRAVLRQILES